MNEIEKLRHNEAVYKQMLDLIFEPYERVWFTKVELLRKRTDILAGVEEAHKLLNRLIPLTEQEGKP